MPNDTAYITQCIILSGLLVLACAALVYKVKDMVCIAREIWQEDAEQE